MANVNANAKRSVSWLEELVKGPAGVLGALAALGFVVLSPGDQVKDLARRQEVAVERQAARDSLQDLRATLHERRADTLMARVAADVRVLLLARCLTTKDRALYAQLDCAVHLRR